jgi:tetratricopeptide (TPR) repeat protein
MKTFLPCALLLAPALASAVPPTPAVKEAGSARAKAAAIVKTGEEAFAAQRYEEALRAFEAAYLLDPVPVLLYNIGRAQEELGRYEDAARFFQSYLDRVPDASDRAQVEQRLTLLRGAAAARAEAEKARAEAETARAEAEQARAAARTQDGANLVADQATVGRDDTLAWGLIGGGGALLVTGVVFLTLASGNAQEAEDLAPTRAGLATYQDLEDETTIFQVVGWLGLGLGAASAGAGMALLLMDGGPADDPQVRLMPAPGGLVLGGHF